MKPSFLVAAICLAACQGDETVTGYLGDATVFELETLNDLTLAGRVTMDLSEAGRISGQSPCNQYSASQTAPYPWFEIGPIASTKKACIELSLETDYFEALSRMTLIEVSGDTVILSNDAKEQMVFQASP